MSSSANDADVQQCSDLTFLACVSEPSVLVSP